MTHAERKAIRDNHQPIKWHGMVVCDLCDDKFPCDTVTLLDELDKIDPPCNHLLIMPGVVTENIRSQFNYCPKCGEKL